MTLPQIHIARAESPGQIGEVRLLFRELDDVVYWELAVMQ
jgi:hypothetical protein